MTAPINKKRVNKMSFLNRLQEKVVTVKKKIAEEDSESQSHFTEHGVSTARMDICRQCDHFISVTTTCKKCGCFMILKSKLKESKCPIGKW